MPSLRGVVWAFLWTIWAAFSARCSARAIAPRSNDGPAPYSFAPSQSWDGIDGQWNSFFILIGTPAQYVRVFISTASQQLWAVDPWACTGDKNFANNTIACENSRGMVFNHSASSTYRDQGWYGLFLEENLGISGDTYTGDYGFDSIELGDAGGPVVTNVTMATVVSYYYWLGHLGLHPKPTNFTTFGDQSPSFLTLMKEQGKIPSLSYGYTAGAQYRFTKVLSSLTLGGYDASRFIPNNISYNFAPDNDRDLVVWIQNIAMTDGKQDNATLLSDPINVFIDSTVAEIWLPVSVCQQFQEAFGLQYNESAGLYQVNDTTHAALVAQNANVTFTIGPEKVGGPTTTIVLPYMAFDQVADFPYRGLTTQTKYFPLRQAQNDTQYTLGRTFLQEAYIVVDHERSNFTVSQVAWVNNPPADIVTIHPLVEPHSGGDGASTAAIAGAAVGGAVVVIAALVILFLWRRHVKKKQEKEAAKAKLAAEVAAAEDKLSEKSRESETQPRPPSSEQTETPFVFPKAELPANEMPRHEMSTDSETGSVDKNADGEVQSPTSTAVGTLDTTGTGTTAVTEPVEAENSERPIYEMEGDTPIRSEADGRQLSEKESMIVRERRYNGTDPAPIPSPNTPTDRSETAGPSPTSDVSSEPRFQPPPRAYNRPPLTAADVAMVPRSAGTQLSLISRPSMRGWDGGATGTLPISPLSPRAPVSLEETILSPLSPLTASEGSDGIRTLASSNPDRKRFSYEPEYEDEAEATK